MAGKFTVNAGWDHVPHLSEEQKSEEMARIQPYQREARSKGIPTLGAGAIYPVAEDYVLIDPFQIPDWMPQCYALDVGWNRTAALWAAWDHDQDIVYLYSEYYRAEAEPPVHAQAILSRGKWIPGVIDPASRGRNQKDGSRLISAYHNLGVEMLFPSSNELEAGIYECWIRLSTGRLKVFRSCQNWLKEFRFYQRDEKGRIKDGQQDHLMDCFDSETEVLTATGWSRFEELNNMVRLATVNLDTDEIEYQLPTELICRPYVGKMIEFGGHKLDAVTTPTHRMVVYPRGKEKAVVKSAEDVSVWDRIKLQAKWVGKRRTAVKVEATYGRASEIDPEVWAEVLGWYVAEGSYDQIVQLPGRGYAVAITQVGDEKVEHLRRLLAQTPWSWRYDGASFRTSSKWLWKELHALGSKYEKYVPQWVKDSEPRIIEAFLRGTVAGDGWVQRGRRNYATVSRRLADDMQELFIKVGRTASVRLGRAGSKAATVFGAITETVDQYWVSEWIAPYGLLRDKNNRPNFGPRQYAGNVYCASVPNGTLIVRRNGKPMIAGNCMRYIVLSGLARAVVRPASMWKMRGLVQQHTIDYDPIKY